MIKKLNLQDFIKMASILIIGSCNVVTFSLLFTKVFKNSSLTISSIILIIIATLSGLATYITKRSRKTSSKLNQYNSTKY